MQSPANSPIDPTRRDFLKQVAAATVLASAAELAGSARGQTAAAAATGPGGGSADAPWYRRALRFGQTNIAEIDVARYDILWWRMHWKRTNVQAVIINAGGIVAYYPSKFPLHHRAPGIDQRDLLGELSKAAHDDGIAVIARMDSSKVHRPFYDAHPDWVGVNAAGQPYTSGEFYLTCINSPYYSEFLPDVMREIIERYHPEGFADNIWTGLDRSQICYCANCGRRFQEFAKAGLPTARNWNDPVFRKWIEWSYQRRLEQWDLNNKTTQAAGGKDCLWVGMSSADIASQANTFRDSKEIFERSQIVLLDAQSRANATNFTENVVDGKLVHALAGWDKLMPESMAQYQHGAPQYRLAAKSAPEAQMWMLAGFAGGIQPWWHYVNAYHEDRRIYKTAQPVMDWHKANEQFLINRRPIATVAIGWSQRNTDFFGRDAAAEVVEQPWRGWIHALTRARIPFVPMHLDHLDRDGADLSVLILANVGILSESQVAAIRRFVARGGNLIVSGETGLHDAYGDPLPDFALADLMGVKGGRPGPTPRGGRGGAGAAPAAPGNADQQTYLRLTPELRAKFDGPKAGDEPAPTGIRHPVLAGFDETDILPFGGTLAPGLTTTEGATVLLTFIPSFPTVPPEVVIMRTSHTTLPGLVVNQVPTPVNTGDSGGRVAYLAADLDRRFAMDNFPDHGNLLANLARWAAGERIPLQVQGPGLLDCSLYRQQSRLILHILNLTSAASWRAPIHEFIPVGPLQISIKLPEGIAGKSIKTQVAGQPLAPAIERGTLKFEVKSILDHELIMIE
jgi:hypothetical protein